MAEGRGWSSAQMEGRGAVVVTVRCTRNMCLHVVNGELQQHARTRIMEIHSFNDDCISAKLGMTKKTGHDQVRLM